MAHINSRTFDPFTREKLSGNWHYFNSLYKSTVKPVQTHKSMHNKKAFRTVRNPKFTLKQYFRAGAALSRAILVEPEQEPRHDEAPVGIFLSNK
jgi:hypothetical protein